MAEPLPGWVLGYCLSWPTETSPFGRFQVLGTLRKNTAGNYVVEQSNREVLGDIFGPSGNVFWTLRSAYPGNLENCIVRFRCEPGDDHGTSDERKDWMIIHWDRERNGWQVKRFDGYKIIHENEDAQWQKEPRRIRSHTRGDKLFLRVRPEGRLIGPWLVGDETKGYPGYWDLKPEFSPPKVYSFPRGVESHTPDILLNQHVGASGGARLLEYLMYRPDRSLGEPIDLATPKKKAEWLVDRIVEGASSIIERLDREEPGWRKRIREELENRISEDRHINMERWNQLESILEHLAFDADQVGRLLKHPKFEESLDGHLKAEIETRAAARASEIEAKAKRLAEEAVNLQEKKIDEAQKEADEAIGRAEARSAVVERRLEDLEARLRDREGEWADREQAFNALTIRMNESRDQLARDIALYQLFSSNGHAPASAATKTAPKARPIRPEGKPITSEADFVDKRLRPLIAERLHVHGPNPARMFHAAVCGSRATLIPSPAWARAYVDALGGTGRLTFVNVQPTWLAFEDLWHGGLGPCWERATDDPSAIELVLLRDFNRALPQCYARPLLDLIAGYADELPAPGRGEWPAKLRVLACPCPCPAPPDDSLPISAEVARHFAAIGDLSPKEGETPDPAPGHVAAECWVNWNGRVSVPKELRRSFAKEFDFGPLASSAARDLYSIARRLKGAGASAGDVVNMARFVKVSNPLEYVSGFEVHMKENS